MRSTQVTQLELFLSLLFDLAPKRVCNAFFVTKKAVGSYPAFSTLP